MELSESCLYSSLYVGCCCHPRDKPYLLYFDLAECIYVTSTEVKEIWEGDTSLLDACPTTQVN